MVWPVAGSSRPSGRSDAACRETTERVRAALPEHVSVAGVTLNEDTFTSVQSRLGKVEVVKGANDSAPSSICYAASLHGREIFLTFESGAAGGWSVITGVRLTTGHGARSCLKASVREESLVIPLGVEPGMSRKAIADIVGMCNCGKAGCKVERQATITRSAPMKSDKVYDVVVGITVKFAVDVASEVFAYQTLTD